MRCPACDAVCRPSARFCDQCGSRLTEEPGDATPRRPDLVDGEEQRDGLAAVADAGTSEAGADGDRRVVTALFADLVDYVRMFAEQDAEDVKRRVDGALAEMDAAVARFGGRREKFIGDAIFAVFGHPVARDDDALRAALCALAIRAALENPLGDEAPLAVRFGVATGEVVAAPRRAGGLAETSFTGPAVVIAARIQGLAKAGEILVDDATVRAARDRLEVAERGERRLRGHPMPVRVHALTGERGVHASQPPTGRLVGRGEERLRLSALLDETARTGRGRAAVVIGEAGMGKSRLLADLEREARDAGFAWTWIENVSYGIGEPYRFARTLAQTVADEVGVDSGTLARRLLFTPDLDPAVARRLAGGIAAMAREAAFSGWEAEEVLAPRDPGAAQAAILSASGRYTVRLAEELGPRVIVIDDLHWADESSRPVIEQLLEVTPTLPFLVLLGSRPNGIADAYAGRTAERIELAGLSADETGQLAARVAGGSLAAEDVEAVHERTLGNPLFVGETVRALLEDGSLLRRRGTLRLVKRRSDGIPVTLRALLGARIDALPRASRDVLEVGSVIGMTFDEDLAGHLIGRPCPPAAVARLAEGALIQPLPTGPAWRFAHGLIREAAYAGLLTSRRRLLHAKLADRLTEMGSTRLDEIARHRAAAGDHDRAVPLLEAAARAAMAIGATVEAAGYWTAAADLAPDAAQAIALRSLAEAAHAAGPAGSGG